jgi:hypothetical protein
MSRTHKKKKKTSHAKKTKKQGIEVIIVMENMSAAELKNEATNEVEPKNEATNEVEPKNEATNEVEPKNEATNEVEPKVNAEPNIDLLDHIQKTDTDGDKIINEIHTSLGIVTAENFNFQPSKDWYMNLNSMTGLVPVVVYLELHGLGPELVKKYVVDHALDTMSHEKRLTLAKHIKSPNFVSSSPLEKHIQQYFDSLTVKDGIRSCLVLARNRKNIFYNLNDNFVAMMMDKEDDMYRNRFFVDMDEVSNIFGYIENEEFKMNSGNTKTDMIQQMNDILEMTGSKYWYDTATTKERPQRNSDNMTHLAFGGVLELYLRRLTSEKVNNKKWFLKAEEMNYASR